MKTSIRDVVRRERWAANAAQLRADTDAEVASWPPAPVNGWVAMVDAYFANYERWLFDKWRLYYGDER